MRSVSAATWVIDHPTVKAPPAAGRRHDLTHAEEMSAGQITIYRGISAFSRVRTRRAAATAAQIALDGGGDGSPTRFSSARTAEIFAGTIVIWAGAHFSAW